MKKLSVLALLLFASTISVMAQKSQAKEMTSEERAEKISQKMKADLGLNEEQYKDILSLNQENALKREAKRDDMKKEIEAKREALKAEKKAYNEDMKAILTTEQYVKYLESSNSRNMESRRRSTPRKRGSREHRN